jgi:hypothetical protein
MDGAMLDADSAVRADMLDKKIAAERARAAALTVAHNATGTEDCVLLLDMLGLTPQDGLNDRKQVQA